ncbi:GNAT family N-acetyltransferase [Sphaerotilus microaerophilus]|nr:GNAT family N-acetyltransferase [Sphaerotilus sp. FB-5]
MPTTHAIPAASAVCPLPMNTCATSSATGPYEVSLLQGAQHFETLRAEWSDAVTRMERPSIFITPGFVETSWKFLAEPTDQAWFVVMRQRGLLVGLLPLLVSRVRYLGLPVRIVSHLSTLAGDRPGVLHTIGADKVWQAAFEQLLAHRRDWEIIDIREIDEGSLALNPQTLEGLRREGLTPTVNPITYSGILPIEGSWDNYFKARSSQTRQSFRRAERQLKEACPDLQLDIIDDPQQIEAACNRYLAIEARSWKAEAKVELWADPREQDFLRALLPQLAATQQASVWLLRSGGKDIAGLVRMRQGSVMFERHWTYDPEFNKYSPGTYLRMLAVQQLFGGPCDESDALGMDEPLANRRALASWYPIERRTYRLHALKLPWYHQALYRLSRVAKTARSHWQARKAASAAPAATAPAPGAGDA